MEVPNLCAHTSEICSGSTSPALAILSHKNCIHSSSCGVPSHLGLNFISLLTNDFEQLYMCLLAFHVSYLG